jgi:hypothetical protein
MKVESKAHFQTRAYLQGVRNTWRVLYPSMTEYQVMRKLLKSFQ